MLFRSGRVFNGDDLSDLVSDAQFTASGAAALSCSQSFGKLNSTRTITGNGNLNVLCIQEINLSGGKVITLRGTISDIFILNISGKFVLSGGSKVQVAGGLLPRNVLYNVLGDGDAVTLTGGSGGINCCDAVVDGSILALARPISLNPGLVNGSLISGDDISIASGASVRCASPSSSQGQASNVTITVTGTVDTSRTGGCANDFTGKPITVSCQSSVRVECENSIAPTDGYTTYTQGGWGAPPHGNNPGTLLANNLASIYGSAGLVIGDIYTVKCTTAVAVQNFLPAGTSPGVLQTSYINPTGDTGAGVLAGQTMALKLNVDFSNAGFTASGLANLKVAAGNKLAGYTVAQVLMLANKVMGGSPGVLPSGCSISDLNDLVDRINNNFDGGAQNLGLLVP